MDSKLRMALVIALLILGGVLLFFAVFIETAASSTNDYRMGMVLGLALTLMADALFYWAYANGGVVAKVLACIAGVPASLFIAFDWVTRAPAVFTR